MMKSRRWRAWTMLTLLSFVLGGALLFRVEAPPSRQEGQTIWLTDPGGTSNLPMAALPELQTGNPNPVRAAGLKGRRIEREEWYEYMRTYPGTAIPEQARQKGYDLLQTQTRRLAPSAVDVWESVGPSPIVNANANQFSTNSSGRTTAVLVHPQDSSTIYAGGAQGGVWKTTNAGVTWTPLTDDQPTLAIGSMTFDPTNSSVIYVGTGEPHGGGDSYYGAGILKTVNGGATWTQLGASKFAGMGISNIVVDPTSPTTVYVAASLSVIGRKPVSDRPGIYKSTDGGANWTQKVVLCSTDGSYCASPSALVLDPGNSSVLYAAFDGYGVIKSVDGGTNWSTKLRLDPSQYTVYRVEAAISPSNGSVLYAGLEVAGQSGTSGYIFQSTNGADNWSQSGLQESYCGGQCFYDNIVAVHPTNPNFVLAGGASLYTPSVPGYDGVIFKSADGGTNWTWNSGLSAATTIHPDLHAIAFDPSNSNTIWLGTDGGVYRSLDGGTTWENRNGNLGTLQFQSIALHPTDPNTFYGGMQDNAKTKTTDGGASWVGLDLGDGGSAAIDPFNPSYWYGSRYSQKGSVMSFQRNDRGGSSYWLEWPVKSSGINVNDRVMFYAPLAADPNTAGRVYFGTHRLWRSNNRGDSWTAISGDLTKYSQQNQCTRCAISNFATAPGDSNIILVGTTDGYVQLTTDGGSNWSNVTRSNLPNRFVSDVAIQDSQTMYVVYQGFNANTPSAPGHVFKTTDGGNNWTDVSRTGQANGLPDLPVLAIALDPDAPGNIYLGTDLGVYRSTDGGSNWAPFNQGLPVVAVFDLALKSYAPPQAGKFLWAATHGRSIWRVSLTSAPPTSTPTPTPTFTSTPTPTPSFTPTPTSTPTATPRPSLSLSASALSFIADANLVPPSQNLGISNNGGGSLTWTAKEWSGGGETNLPWLSLSAAAGTAPSTIQVTVDKSQISAGTTVSGQIRVDATSAGAQNTPQYVDVTFKYSASPLARVFLPAVAKGYAPPTPIPTVTNTPAPTATGTATPTATRTAIPTATSTPVVGWTTIMQEDFEGTFPGAGWRVLDNQSGYGEYYWARRTCRFFAGSYGGWAVGGGANGGGLSCGASYPNDAQSWMIYGPFSLVGATAADLTLKLWLNSETGWDKVAWLASINGTNFYGEITSGDSGGWVDRTLDLSNVYSLGNLLNQPTVWIAFVFQSDGSQTYAEGAYVDNVVLRKYLPGYAGETPPTTDMASSAPEQTLNESPAHLELDAGGSVPAVRLFDMPAGW